jgi:O-antigen/teichoic acid export membrane protein
LKKFYSLIFSEKTIRSKVAVKNILLSGFVKGLNILVSFLTVPLSLKYLSQEVYGIWLTIYSIMNWLMYFDGGLGSGLRNRFAESKAKNEHYKIQSYISTSYFILFCTIILLIPLLYIFNIWFDWASVLNIKGKEASGFNNTIFIIFVIFCLQFVFRLIDSILIADQKSGESDFLNMLGSLISLIVFYFVTLSSSGSLLLVGLVFCGVPLLVNITYTIYLFFNRYSTYKPKYQFVDIKFYKELMTIGSKFFVIQICSLITLGSTNVIITKVLGSSEVVLYNISFKYFSFILLAFGILTSSLYSSFNDAYYREDHTWIKNIIKKIKWISILFLFGLLIMVISARYIYNLWIGSSININMTVNILMAVYYAITIWVSVYATFVSAVGKIQIAYYVSIINSIIYIPLSIFLAKFMGIEGVITSQILLIISGLYWLPTQYKKIINNEAAGLWNK